MYEEPEQKEKAIATYYTQVYGLVKSIYSVVNTFYAPSFHRGLADWEVYRVLAMLMNYANEVKDSIEAISLLSNVPKFWGNGPMLPRVKGDATVLAAARETVVSQTMPQARIQYYAAPSQQAAGQPSAGQPVGPFVAMEDLLME